MKDIHWDERICPLAAMRDIPSAGEGKRGYLRATYFLTLTNSNYCVKILIFVKFI